MTHARHRTDTTRLHSQEVPGGLRPADAEGRRWCGGRGRGGESFVGTEVQCGRTDSSGDGGGGCWRLHNKADVPASHLTKGGDSRTSGLHSFPSTVPIPAPHPREPPADDVTEGAPATCTDHRAAVPGADGAGQGRVTQRTAARRRAAQDSRSHSPAGVWKDQGPAARSRTRCTSAPLTALPWARAT